MALERPHSPGPGKCAAKVGAVVCLLDKANDDQAGHRDDRDGNQKSDEPVALHEGNLDHFGAGTAHDAVIVAECVGAPRAA